MVLYGYPHLGVIKHCVSYVDYGLDVLPSEINRYFRFPYPIELMGYNLPPFNYSRNKVRIYN